jgi:hypothetical protein
LLHRRDYVRARTVMRHRRNKSGDAKVGHAAKRDLRQPIFPTRVLIRAALDRSANQQPDSKPT